MQMVIWIAVTALLVRLPPARGTNHRGYNSVRHNDGDTEALMLRNHASSTQGSGSSYEDGDSGDNCSDGPANHPTGYVEDCHDYSNEDHGGYDDHNSCDDYDDYDDCDDDYYD